MNAEKNYYLAIDALAYSLRSEVAELEALSFFLDSAEKIWELSKLHRDKAIYQRNWYENCQGDVLISARTSFPKGKIPKALAPYIKKSGSGIVVLPFVFFGSFISEETASSLNSKAVQIVATNQNGQKVRDKLNEKFSSFVSLRTKREFGFDNPFLAILLGKIQNETFRNAKLIYESLLRDFGAKEAKSMQSRLSVDFKMSELASELCCCKSTLYSFFKNSMKNADKNGTPLIVKSKKCGRYKYQHAKKNEILKKLGKI